MAEFKDASMRMKLAFLTLTIGLLLNLFAYAGGLYITGGLSMAAEAMFVIGLLCFVPALFMVIALVFLDFKEDKDKERVLIAFIVCAIIAGVATLIGIIVWGAHPGVKLQAMPGTHGVLACLLAIAAGVLGIMEKKKVEFKVTVEKESQDGSSNSL